MHPIFLIGYMGSGKTTLGKAVSARASIDFIDLDEYIEAEAGATVSEIFAAEGEDGFRRRERAALASLCNRDNLLVACGGGTPCFFDNMATMNRCGTTVLLEAGVDVLAERLRLQRSERPLVARLADDELEDFITEAIERRRPFYETARHRFDANSLADEAQVAESARKFIARFIK